MTFDDNIDCHNNRYVISVEKGNEMLQELQQLIVVHYLITLIVLAHEDKV